MSNELSPFLSADEQRRFDQLRRVATDSIRDFCEAMREIRDSKLYRDEYDTFESFCQVELGKTRQRINQILNADLLRSELESDPSLETIVSKTNEGVMREIAKAPPELRNEVAKKVAAKAELDGKVPTAKQVKAVVAEVVAPIEKSEEEPSPAKPVTVQPSNSHLHFPAADLAAPLLDLAKQFSAIKKRLTELGKQPGGELCRQIASDATWLMVDTLRGRMLNAVFVRACPHCDGKGCARCGDRGWQSQSDVTCDERAGK